MAKSMVSIQFYRLIIRDSAVGHAWSAATATWPPTLIDAFGR